VTALVIRLAGSPDAATSGLRVTAFALKALKVKIEAVQMTVA
jgi:hypothetical protein